MADGLITLTGQLDDAGKITGTSTVKRFPIAHAARYIGLPDPLPTFETALTGNVELSGDFDSLSMNLDLLAQPVPFVQYPLPKDEGLHTNGDLTYATTNNSLLGGKTTLRLGTDGHITANNWQSTLDPLSWRGAFDGAADLGAIAARFGLGPLSGNSAFAGEGALSASVFNGDATVETDGLVYSGFGLSYGTPLILNGGIEANLETSKGALTNLVANIGEGTQVDWSSTVFGWSPATTFSGAFTATTNLLPLVDMGLLASADGSARASGTVALDENGFRADVAESTIEAFVAELPDALVRFSGLSAEGSGGYGADGFFGEWRLAAARTEAAGVVMSDVAGKATVEDESIRLDLNEGYVYDGRLLLSEVTINLGNGPLTLDGTVQLRDVDLATFTREFEPPGTSLTGEILGVLQFTIEGEEITFAEVKLRAPDGFSINKDLIREQLLRQTVSDATYGMIFGEKDDDPEGQRHFDSAELELTYNPEARELQGEAKMLSKELRLTMPMTVDIRVITEAIKHRQLRALENMENIRLAPVELNE